jgi:hypothetical protein
MNEEWLLTLALATHGNAALGSTPCGCQGNPSNNSPLKRLSSPAAMVAWIDGVRARGAHRMWMNVFQGENGKPGGWGIEVEREQSAEVWRAVAKDSGFELEQMISQIPLSPRTVRLEDAHQALKVALSETHRLAIEARDAELAETLISARECLDGAGAPDAQHILPDAGYGPQARALFRAAMKVVPIQNIAPQLQQALFASALAAAHTPER